MNETRRKVRQHKWFYVRTDRNPAELLTRHDNDGLNNQMWWTGPEFLRSTDAYDDDSISPGEEEIKEIERELKIEKQTVLVSIKERRGINNVINQKIQRYAEASIRAKKVWVQAGLASLVLHVHEFPLLNIFLLGHVFLVIILFVLCFAFSMFVAASFHFSLSDACVSSAESSMLTASDGTVGGELTTDGRVCLVPYISSYGDYCVLALTYALCMKDDFWRIDGHAYFGRFSSAITHRTSVLIDWTERSACPLPSG